MAYGGSTHFPAGSLDLTFADLGVGFGRDQNADTSLSVTEYKLDLNDSDTKKLDTAFRWVRDIADGDTLDEAAVERERGVILSEREARLSPAQKTRTNGDAFREQGLRSPTRIPIGTVESISTMTGARLRAFYDRWYRPEAAVVVVVGDDSPSDLEKRVKDAFASWTGKGAKPTRPARNKPDPNRGLDALTQSEPQLPSSESVCRLRATDDVSLRTVRRLRWLTLRDIWKRILDERLSRVAEQDKPPFLRAGVNFEGRREIRRGLSADFTARRPVEAGAGGRRPPSCAALRSMVRPKTSSTAPSPIRDRSTRAKRPKPTRGFPKPWPPRSRTTF